MRKHTLIFLLTLLLCLLTLGLNAEENKSFKLLQSSGYKLDVYYSTELQRIYVQADFDIPRDQLDPESYYGFFLSSDAIFQNALVAEEYAPHYFINNLVPEHFQPALSQPELVQEGSGVKFIGLTLKDFDKFPEIVHFRLWYTLPVPTPTLDDMGKLSSTLNGKLFWYPRNTVKSSTVSIELLTTPYISLLIGNIFAPYTDKDNSRMHKGTFLEMVEQPCSLRLIRD